MEKTTEQGTMGKEAFWLRLQTNLDRIAIAEIARIMEYADDDAAKAANR